MNVWIKNSKLLKRYFPDFYTKAISLDYACNDLQITGLNDGNLFLQSSTCNCFLHSTYNIDREMRELFREATDSEQILIIFGLGMGYCLDYIQKQRIRYRRVLILEPFNNIFREMLKIRDLELLLKKRNVSLSIFNDPREIMPQIMGQIMTSRKVKFIYHMSYRSLYGEVYQEISRIFSEEKLSFMASTSTINYFLNEWTENQLISIAKKQPAADVLNNRFKNIPAVIISAGPSLEKRIDELKEIQDKALIIAPGTGARVCKQKGIKAHVAIAMDSQKAEANIFRDSDIDLLVGSYRLHPEVDKVFPNRLLRMAISNDYIAQYYHHWINYPADIISDHASVSSSAVDFAVKLGCNPIILVGQDLCYYDHKVHAGEEKDSLPESTRKALQEAVDINGEKVYTEPGFFAIRRDMELLNLKYRDTHTIINSTQAGLGMPGIENRDFRDVIDRYIILTDTDVRKIIEETINEKGYENVYADVDINAFYRHVLEEIDKLENINEDKRDQLSQLHQLLETDAKDSRLKSNMRSIEETNQQLQENYFYQNVVLPMLKQFLIYYQVGIFYNFDGNIEDPEAWFYYETNLYNLSSRYLKIIKNITERELRGNKGEKQFEGANFTVAVNTQEIAGEAGVPNKSKSDQEQEGILTIPFGQKVRNNRLLINGGVYHGGDYD